MFARITFIICHEFGGRWGTYILNLSCCSIDFLKLFRFFFKRHRADRWATHPNGQQIGPTHESVLAWSTCSWPSVKREEFNGATNVAQSEVLVEFKFWVRVRAQIGPTNERISTWWTCSWSSATREQCNGAIDFAQNQILVEVKVWVCVRAQIGPTNDLWFKISAFNMINMLLTISQTRGGIWCNRFCPK